MTTKQKQFYRAAFHDLSNLDVLMCSLTMSHFNNRAAVLTRILEAHRGLT